MISDNGCIISRDIEVGTDEAGTIIVNVRHLNFNFTSALQRTDAVVVFCSYGNLERYCQYTQRCRLSLMTFTRVAVHLNPA